MKILCILIVHNAAEMLPFTFRHYDQFVDEYWVFDDHSTDGTLELLRANPRVKLRDYDQPEGLYEETNQFLIYRAYPEAVGKFGWCIAVDPDEFLIGNGQMGVLDTLVAADACGREVVPSVGFNLLGPEFPKDDGKSQIYELNPMGVRAPVYDKPVVFKPHINIRWMRGRHQLEHCNPDIGPIPLKLLHARYFGSEHTRKRNAINYHRLGLLNGDKGPGWSVSPEWDGADASREGSPLWSEWAQQFAFNTLEVGI